MNCSDCLYYVKKKGFCEWTRRNVKRYVIPEEYACIGYVNKQDTNIRGTLYES